MFFGINKLTRALSILMQQVDKAFKFADGFIQIHLSVAGNASDRAFCVFAAIPGWWTSIGRV